MTTTSPAIPTAAFSLKLQPFLKTGTQRKKHWAVWMKTLFSVTLNLNNESGVCAGATSWPFHPLWKQPTAASPFILQMWPRWPSLTKEQPATTGFTSTCTDLNPWLVKVCLLWSLCSDAMLSWSTSPNQLTHTTSLNCFFHTLTDELDRQLAVRAMRRVSEWFTQQSTNNPFSLSEPPPPTLFL